MTSKYYDDLIRWCEYMCERTYRLESPDASMHCYFKGQQVDFQNTPKKRPCFKCPYNRDYLWQAKVRKDIEAKDMLHAKEDIIACGREKPKFDYDFGVM